MEALNKARHPKTYRVPERAAIELEADRIREDYQT